MIASLGAGIYSAPDAITWQSVLVNGGVILCINVGKSGYRCWGWIDEFIWSTYCHADVLS